MPECDKVPEGWFCSRDAGHDGPCPTFPNLQTPEEAAQEWMDRALTAEAKVEQLEADIKELETWL